MEPGRAPALGNPGRASAPEALRRAVFLDRAGVRDPNVVYPDTGCYESPRTAADLVLCPGVVAALLRLRQAGFCLILVSNQPNAVKGKCSLDELHSIHTRLCSELAAGGIILDGTYYCYHHPDLSGPCPCRKPEPYFLKRAAGVYHLNLQSSWMIGDRPSDIECGHRAGASSIWIDAGEGMDAREAADFTVHSLNEAAELVLGRG